MSVKPRFGPPPVKPASPPRVAPAVTPPISSPHVVQVVEAEPPVSAPAPLSTPFIPTQGLVIAQKYRLERLLKRGGMGAVWVATHLALDTEVAVKFMMTKLVDLPPGLEPDATPSDEGVLTRVRFEREAKAAARIRSSNVVQILDHGVDQNTPYIVMELLRGEDLGTRIKRAGRLSVDALVPIVTAVARALQMAHADGLVHRDLKPENIFLAKEGDEEVPKVLDFGVAKAKHVQGDMPVDESTVAGAVVGTPQYMSPEQIQGKDHLDHRADLWSLGIVIFRALTGKMPFRAPMLLELVVQVCTAPLPKASALAPDLGPDVDAFFEKALCRDPAGRFQSARELVAAFRDLSPLSIPMRASMTSWPDSIPTPPPGSVIPSVTLSGLAPAPTGADKPAAVEPAADKPASKPPIVAIAVAVAAVLAGLGAAVVWMGRSSPPTSPAVETATAPPEKAPELAPAPAPTPSAVPPTSGTSETADVAASGAPEVATTTAPQATATPPVVPGKLPTAKPWPTATTKKRNVGY